MPIKFNIKIKQNTELIKDIEDLINKHRDNIENVTTQYIQLSSGTLWHVDIQFHPVWLEQKNGEGKSRYD